ncbi:uncharacterized protein LOC141720346 [Apium graveolens]|uniref:uncharacterized protein LOC141720346 n=1 Tax=Apium graveolens TaxID=4045 RepID=UPI003D7BB65D
MPNAPPPVLKHILDIVSSASVDLGRSMSSSFTLSDADVKKLSKMNYVSRVLLWSREQVAASKVKVDHLSKVEKVANVVKNKTAAEHQKATDAEAKLKIFEADAADRVVQLKEKISTLEKELKKCEKAKLDAQTTWYGVGLDKRL